MLNIFDIGIPPDTNILVGGVYNLIDRKIIWADTSSYGQVDKNFIKKLLPYSLLSSPLVI